MTFPNGTTCEKIIQDSNLAECFQRKKTKSFDDKLGKRIRRNRFVHALLIIRFINRTSDTFYKIAGDVGSRHH